MAMVLGISPILDSIIDIFSSIGMEAERIIVFIVICWVIYRTLLRDE